MIDHVDPLCSILWAIVAFSASLYPLGFMLGASCSPCCKSDCDEVFDFNRCIRFVNTNTTNPPSSLAPGESQIGPLHGFSRVVTRPEQAGAVRVATSLVVNCSIAVLDGAAAMSDGETSSASYSIRYKGGTADYGEAVNWAVTLQGVTIPLSPPDVVNEMLWVDLYNTPSDSSVQYQIGRTDISVLAPVSVSVHSCDASEVAQWLDGAAVTEGTLKDMLRVSVSRAGSPEVWVVTATAAPVASVFRYVPQFKTFNLKYVIKHTRGNTHRYSICYVTLRAVSVPQAIPPNGLVPYTATLLPYVNSPSTRTPPVFGGGTPTSKTAVIYSDNVNLEDEFNGVGIACPGVEVQPVGVQLRFSASLAEASGVQATAGQYLSPAMFPSTTVTKRGWIMRPYDPDYGIFNLSNPLYAFNEWIYDTQRVADWLNGEITVPYNSGSLTYSGFLDGTPSRTWAMQVSEAVALCGESLCSQSRYSPSSPLRFATSPGVIEKVVMYTPAPQPQTRTSSDEKGTVTYTNYCYGQDSVPSFPLNLTACSYGGYLSTCQSVSSATLGPSSQLVTSGSVYVDERLPGPPQRYAANISLRSFYCGDLLWVIEHGPCRSVVSQGGNTYTLGGDSAFPFDGTEYCHTYIAQNPGACMPLEATLTINTQYDILCYAGASVNAGKTLAGDYVCSAAAGGVRGTTNCLQQVFTGVIPYMPAAGSSITYANNQLPVTVVRRRAKWCDAWNDNYAYLWFGNFCLCGLDPGSCAAGVNVPSPLGYNLPGSSVTYGSTTTPLASATVNPQVSTVPVNGGSVSLSYCCPQSTQTVAIPANESRNERVWHVLGTNKTVMAYVTQPGINECLFDVIWLSGSVEGGGGRIFTSVTCPIVGQVTHQEQPGCDWSVEALDSWLVARKTSDGLLEISINSTVTPSWSGSTPGRQGTVVVTSRGTVNQWTIFQLRP